MLSSLKSKYCNLKGKVKKYMRENVLVLANVVANELTLQLANDVALCEIDTWLEWASFNNNSSSSS